MKTKVAKVVNPEANAYIPGSLIEQYETLFSGERVKVAVIEVDAKYVSSTGGLVAPITGAYVNQPMIYSTQNKVFSANAGDVVVLVGRKASGIIAGFSSKEIDIISKYEAAKAYYTFRINHSNKVCSTNLSIEEYAIAWLAASCNEEYWRSTVFSALKRHDSKIRHLEKKYYKQTIKDAKANQTAQAPANIEEAFAELSAQLSM